MPHDYDDDIILSEVSTIVLTLLAYVLYDWTGVALLIVIEILTKLEVYVYDKVKAE